MSTANFAMLLTPPGPAAIATIRIHGPVVAPFLAAHFSKPMRSARCTHGNLADGSRLLDDPVVMLIDQQTADLHLHGGPWVVQETVALLSRSGFKFPSGSIPLWTSDAPTTLEREIEIALPQARTELALRILLLQKQAWSRFRSKIKNQKSKIPSIRADPSLTHLLNPPRVAIIGAPNVGKSTLANQLFAQERSITADLPGTTRDWVGELANLDGLVVMLLDTPGVRHTADPIEQTAIARSQPVIATADLVVLVLDSTRPLEPVQSPLLQQWPAALRVANKSDQPPAWDVSALSPLKTVATTGQGLDDLRRAIRQYFKCEKLEPDEPRIWTRRQRDILQRALTDEAALAEL